MRPLPYAGPARPGPWTVGRMASMSPPEPAASPWDRSAPSRQTEAHRHCQGPGKQEAIPHTGPQLREEGLSSSQHSHHGQCQGLPGHPATQTPSPEASITLGIAPWVKGPCRPGQEAAHPQGHPPRTPHLMRPTEPSRVWGRDRGPPSFAGLPSPALAGTCPQE